MRHEVPPPEQQPAELADQVRHRIAEGLPAGPALSDDLIERLRALLPPVRPSGGAETT